MQHPPVRCAGCTGEIEACQGRYGDWMHTDTRSELCPTDGLLAWPETVADINRLRRAS